MKKGLMIAAVLMLLLVFLGGCRYNPFHTHTPKTVSGFPATCTNSGLTDGSFCIDCGETLVKQVATPPVGHRQIIMPAKDATCTKDGYTEYTVCADCNVTLVSKTLVPAKGHVAVKKPGVAATCTQNGKTEGSYCEVCDTVLVKQRHISAKGHQEVVLPGKEATCKASGLTQGSKCQICEEVLVAQNTVPKSDHVAVKVPAVEATCYSTGLTEGQVCKWCNKVMKAQKKTDIVGHKKVVVTAVLPTQTTSGKTQGIYCKWCNKAYLKALDPDRYNSRYGYEYLGTLKNGKALQEMYDRVDLAVQRFHLDASANAEYVSNGDFYTMPYVDVSDLNIPVEDINKVMETFQQEHQLYYWIQNYNYYYYTESNLLSKVTYLVYPEYIQGKDRAAQNLRVYQVVQDLAITNSSAYKLAKYYHDKILDNMYYAYEKDGVTPQDAQWAHNIIGYVEYGTGVCECYAEMFHVMMNYSGAQCIRVSGMSGDEGHAWNLAKMDDGNWYWFDLTWDDQKTMIYNYFCVNDTQKVSGDQDFLDEHEPDPSNVSSGRFQYPLPERSKKEYPK